jgi:hypothetical protein
MKLTELKIAAKYFVMDISHEEGRIQFHVLSTKSDSDEYHIQVFVDEKTNDVISISGWDATSKADVKKDAKEIIEAVNDEIKKQAGMHAVSMTPETKININ